MFDTLVESGSHKDDIARKGSFLLGTFIIYTVVLVGLGILSIYLYNSNLPDPSLELLSFVTPVQEPPAPAAPEPEQQKQAAAAPEKTEYVERVELSSIVPPDLAKVKEEAKRETPPPPPGVVVKIGERNYDPANAYRGPVGIGPVGDGSGGGGTPEVRVENTEEPPPPPPKPTPEPPKRTAPISGGVLNGKAVSRVNPQYPAIAKQARVSGSVTVQITVDENGRVVSAQAVSGHPLLQSAAVSAVRQWRFTPTLLSGQPVKVTGQVIVNFNLQ